MKHPESLLSTAGVEALGLSLITKWQHIFFKVKDYNQNVFSKHIN